MRAKHEHARIIRSVVVTLACLGAGLVIFSYLRRYGVSTLAADRAAVRAWLGGDGLYAYRSPETRLGTTLPPVAALLLAPAALLPLTLTGWLLALTGLAALTLSATALAGPVARRYGRPRGPAVLIAVALALLVAPARATIGEGCLDLVLFGLITADVVALRRGAWARSRAAWWPGRPASEPPRSRTPADLARRPRTPADLIRRSRTAADLARRSHSPADLAQRSRTAPDLAQRSHPPADLAQRSRTAPDLARRSRRPLDLIRRSHRPLDLIRRSHRPLDLIRRSHRPLDLIRGSHRPADLIRRSSTAAGLIRRAHTPADLVRRAWATGAWAGVGVGVATALAVAPVLFIAYLAVSRQWRAALTAVATTATLLTASALIAPGATATWLAAALRMDRSGPLGAQTNQSLAGVLARLYDSTATPVLIWLSFAGLLLAVGMIRARAAHADGDEIAAFTLIGLTIAAVCPATHIHELIWALPAILILLDAAARHRATPRRKPRRRLPAAAAATAAALTYLLLLAPPAWSIAWNGYAFAVILLLNALPWRPGVAPAIPARRRPHPTGTGTGRSPAIPGPRAS